MISYTLWQKNPASHYIYIDLVIDNVNGDTLTLQLPAWRPGRYELGNFARNVKRVDAFGAGDKPLDYRKVTKDRWEIACAGEKEVKVTYSYYAAEMTAGSCFADGAQMYVNPVHCCMYVPARMNETHRVTLKVPGEWKIACSLQRDGQALTADSYETLADSPFIASAGIETFTYSAGGTRFHLHFNGICKPDNEKVIRDFTAFSKHQVEFWGDMPCDEYHFLFQVLPYKYYHGVEHLQSTVIALGPGYAINSSAIYDELLGVSSHELFHVWNVKTIRPAEMLPYDYTRENYAATGFVYEGFTTYYGDKLLLASGVFSIAQYFKTLEERLQRHFHNYGRYNLGVAASSRDTWLDGYAPGAPYRKTSIYDEGCLIAFMLDVTIMRATGNERSLRDMCRLLYERFGKAEKGYTENDIVALAGEAAGKDMLPFFREFVYGAADYKAEIVQCLDYLGIELHDQSPAAVSDELYGFKVIESAGPAKITLVAPYSPAWKAGLFAGDEIVAVNGMAVRGNFNQWLEHFKGDLISLHAISGEMLREFTLESDKRNQRYFTLPKLALMEKTDENRKKTFERWKST